MRNKILFLIVLFYSAIAFSAEKEHFVYYTIEPDFIINFTKPNSKKLGFGRVRVELVLNDPNAVAYVEHHLPLISDGLVSVLNSKSEEEITTLAGRETIRQDALERLNELMVIESRQKIIKDLLFSRFIFE
jgi:flagellar FliL protein